MGKSGGNELLLVCVQIGTLIIGLILMLADLVLSSPFFITLLLLPTFSLFPIPFFLSSVDGISVATDLPDEDEDDEEEDGDRVEGRCFRSLSNSFHKTVHLGGLGDGSSSRNQLILLSWSLLCSASLPGPASLATLLLLLLLWLSCFRLSLLSFSAWCICQKGRSLPSEISSSAVIIFVVRFPDKNSKWSVFLEEARSVSRFCCCCCCCWSLSARVWGQMEMKLFSSRNSDEKEMRGPEITGSAVAATAWRASRETICGGGGGGSVCSVCVLMVVVGGLGWCVYCVCF